LTVALLPDVEPTFVNGQPYIYGLHFAAVDGWYIGKNETGRGDYMGSPSRAVVQAIAEAHAKVGLHDVPQPTKRLLWSPAGATRAECRDQEWFWIARARAEHRGPVFNLFPIQDWSNHFDWVHDKVTHVDRATNSRWPVVYIKLQASCDAVGNCSGGKSNWYGKECGQPWGDQTRGVYWSKVVYPDDTEEMLCPPGRNRARAYQRFLEHKLDMIRGPKSP